MFSPARRSSRLLVEQDAEQRLDAGDENAAIFEQEFVVERDFGVPHGNFLSRRTSSATRKNI